MYTIGYLTGYKECENIAQQEINEMIMKESGKMHVATKTKNRYLAGAGNMES